MLIVFFAVLTEDDN